jgi:hypothetical protein
MARLAKYRYECPSCNKPDRVTRKGQYKNYGPGFYRMICHACKCTFTRFIPEAIGLAPGSPAPPLPDTKQINQGENHPQAKLTAANVRDIVALFDSGSDADELAERYGVAKPTIVGILRGDTWAHLTHIQSDNPRAPRTRKVAR